MGSWDSQPEAKARGSGGAAGEGEKMPNPEASEGNGRDCEPVAGGRYWCETEGLIEEAVG